MNKRIYDPSSSSYAGEKDIRQKAAFILCLQLCRFSEFIYGGTDIIYCQNGRDHRIERNIAQMFPGTYPGAKL